MIIKTKKISLLVCLAIGLLMQPAYILAQSQTTLREDQKSVAVIDLRVDKLMKEFVAAGVNAERFSGAKLSGPFAGTSVSQVDRVYGATCLPKDISTLKQILADPNLKGFPVFSSVACQALTNGCFLQIKLVDKAVADDVEARWKKKSLNMKVGKFDHDIPWGQKEDKDFFARRVDETTIEFGSKDYLQQANRSFFTDRLAAVYQSSAGDALRLILDLETRQQLLKEVIKLGKKEVPRPTHAYLDLVESLKSMNLGFSFGSEDLLRLVAEANGDSDAAEFAEGINSLLQLGKVGAGTLFSQISRDAPEGAREPMAMIKGMIDGLAAEQSGTTVKVLLKKPENFVAMLGQFAEANAEHMKINNRMSLVRKVALTINSYEKIKKQLPFNSDAKDAHQSISWRVKLLPFIKKRKMASQMDLLKPASESPNTQFAEGMPKDFGTDKRLSNVLWVQSGVDTLADVKDGTANTIMLIESPEGRPWIENKPLTVDEAVAMVKGLSEGQDLVVGLYDGSVSMVTSQISEETLRNLFIPDDGNAVDNSWKK